MQSQSALQEQLPFFSVIVPCYNGDQYIRNSINSVLQQSFEDYEIIVINDGSTDNSAEILNEFSTQYYKISVYHQNNQGLSAARNKGVSHARGKWIVLLDADDLYESERLSHLYELISNYPDCKFFCHDAYLMSYDGEVDRGSTYVNWSQSFEDIKQFVVKNNSGVCELDADIWKFLLCRYTMLLPITICVKADLLTLLENPKLPFDQKLIVGEDVDFCVRCLIHLDSIIYSSAIESCYRLTPNSITNDAKYIPRKVKYFKTMRAKFFERLDRGNQLALERRRLDTCLLASYVSRENSRWADAFYYALQGFWLKPSIRSLKYVLKSVFPVRRSKVNLA